MQKSRISKNLRHIGSDKRIATRWPGRTTRGSCPRFRGSVFHCRRFTGLPFFPVPQGFRHGKFIMPAALFHFPRALFLSAGCMFPPVPAVPRRHRFPWLVFSGGRSFSTLRPFPEGADGCVPLHFSRKTAAGSLPDSPLCRSPGIPVPAVFTTAASSSTCAGVPGSGRFFFLPFFHFSPAGLVRSAIRQ